MLVVGGLQFLFTNTHLATGTFRNCVLTYLSAKIVWPAILLPRRARKSIRLARAIGAPSRPKEAMEGSDDIFVHKFSISMGGKTLFKDAKLSLAHGRRYGLIGAPAARPRAQLATDA